MAKTADPKPEAKTEAADQAPAVPTAPSTAAQPQDGWEFPVTLDNFCAELSQGDRRVELIGGFHYTERAAGRNKDLASAYRHRYDTFTTRAL